MYCQVTQLEQQGGPEIWREMVRDREKAVHERVSGWRRFVNALEKGPHALAGRYRIDVEWQHVLTIMYMPEFVF